MKILFAGCSFIAGAEIEKEERMSTLVCDYFGADEYNLANSGQSNMLSTILTITESEKIRPDYIVFGLTFPKRTFGMNDMMFSLSSDDAKQPFGTADTNGNYVSNDVTFGINVLGNNVIEGIENYVPVFRNDLVAFTEMTSLINMLVQYSRIQKIPLALFQSVVIDEVTKNLNGTSLVGTPFRYPPLIPEWTNLGDGVNSFFDLGTNIGDMQPMGHPGPNGNKAMAQIIIEKIKKDLNI